MDNKKIGNFISNCRKEKGLIQNNLAEKLNVSDKTISRWENGINMPEYSIINNLCNILKINVNELLNGQKENVNADEITLENIKINQGIILLGCTFFFLLLQ